MVAAASLPVIVLWALFCATPQASRRRRALWVRSASDSSRSDDLHVLLRGLFLAVCRWPGTKRQGTTAFAPARRRARLECGLRPPSAPLGHPPGCGLGGSGIMPTSFWGTIGAFQRHPEEPARLRAQVVGGLSSLRPSAERRGQALLALSLTTEHRIPNRMSAGSGLLQ
jgi:hypothetical protein